MVDMKTTITIRLTEAEIKEAIQAYLASKVPIGQASGPFNIVLGMTIKSTGYGLNEIDEEVFSATATRDE